MIDQNSQFFTILTRVGEAKQANADALGVPWTFSHMAVGDAAGSDPVPDRLQTRLINERRRAPLNQVRVDPDNPGIIITEQVIPPEAGGWWIRELGLYDADGDLVAVGNCAPSYKPLLAQGTGKTQVVRIRLVVSSAGNITLKIDPSVVLATRAYVDGLILGVLPEIQTPGTYRRVTINKRGIVIAGDNPTKLGDYGITDALRVAADFVSAQRPRLCAPSEGGDGIGLGGALEIREVNEVGASRSSLGFAPSILFHWGGRLAKLLALGADGQLYFGGKKVFAEDNLDLSSKADRSTTLGGYGISDAYKKVDVDWLVSQAVLNLAIKATTLAGYGIVDAYTRAQVDNAIQAAINALVNGAGASLDTLRELAVALNNDPNFAASVSNELSRKFNKTGGGIDGAVSVSLAGQSLGNPGIAINNPSTSAGAQAILTLACGNTLVNLIHSNQDATLYLRNNAGLAPALSAGTFLSNGSPVHTADSFLKPTAAQWVQLSGSGPLPAGGTWAYFTIGFNGNGASLGSTAGIAAGGAVVGHNSNCLGFAWRIQ